MPEGGANDFSPARHGVMNHAEKADSLVALPGIYQGKPCKGII